jgi:hypothetical protein
VKTGIKKVVLAYSGGLDTSVILKWLQDRYGCEVITFTADIGQGEELEPARRKAKKMGVKRIFVEDLREEFVRDFVFPMHVDRAAADREASGQSRKTDGRRRDLARRHRQGQRPGAVRARRLRPDARGKDHRAVARMGPALARQAAALRREASHPGGLQEKERRRALLDGRQPAAYLL